MPNGDDEDKLLDQLAERLKAIRHDAELVRSGGIEGVTGALERVQTGLRDLAASVEALSLRVEQQQAISARVAAVATKGQADTQALSQTVEALSVRMRQQAETLDRLSTPRRSRFGTFRFALMIAVLVVGGGMVTFLISAHKAGFGPLSHLFIGWFSGGTRLTRSGDASTGPAQAMTNATPDSVSASVPLAPSDSAAMSPVALAQTKDNAPAIAAASATAAPPPATPVGVETQDRAQAAIAFLPAQSPAVDVAQPPEAPAPAPSAPIDTSKSPPASTEARSEVPAATIAPAPGKSPAPDAAVPAGATLSTSTMPPARSIPSAPATAMAVSSQVPKATPQLVLHATEDAWVRVRASDGRVVLNRTLRKGETWSVPVDPGFILDTGNAAGLEVQVDGAPISLAAAKGSVIRNVLLDAGAVGSNGERSAR